MFLPRLICHRTERFITVPTWMLRQISHNSRDSLQKQVLFLISTKASLNNDDKLKIRKYWSEMADYKNLRKQRTALLENSILHKMKIEDFVEFINRTKSSSMTARGLYRRECLYQCKDDLALVNEVVAQVSSAKQLKPLDTPLDTMRWSVDDAFSTADIVMAADLFLLYYKLFTDNVQPDEPYARKIISALAYPNPMHDHVHLVKYLEMNSLFEKRVGNGIRLTRFQLETLSNKALGLSDDAPQLCKAILNKLMNINYFLTAESKLRDDQILLAYKSIDENYRRGNVASIYSTWNKIKGHYVSITAHDSRIIYKVLKICTHNRAYRSICSEIFWQLTPEYYCNNPLLLPAIIDFITKRDSLPMAKELMQNISRYTLPENHHIVWLNKRCLSSLLRMHLKFNDSNGVDRVLKQITTNFRSLSQENYQAIIIHLFKTQNLDHIAKAIKLLDTIPPKQAMLAYGSIINELVDWKLASKVKFTDNLMALINELLMKAHDFDPEHRSSLWNVVSSLYIKKLCHYKKQEGKYVGNTEEDIDLAKLLYLNASKKEKIHWTKSNCNPFIISTPSDVKLKINNQNRFAILRNIALSALQTERIDIFLWACAELYQNGMTIEELRLDWNIMLKHQLRNSEFKTNKEIVQDIKKHGVSSIKRYLR
ncbi:carbohydrate-binding module 1 protein [Saccharomyces pastorianus]|uniref:Carbohydrate-binding module 1 protein n=1 Tax=Saccharomyces pastorianus TaxID=27292 RepID=A0A6C1E9B6_SACPS|nr:CBP1-like protein [Saccharomyces eubayanus]KOG98421.1 CBP1-like protein [Saccharomyces eubayanus]QID85928.1 carbohydrate-binding module 1 protein [Saccharomyces pastorianus]